MSIVERIKRLFVSAKLRREQRVQLLLVVFALLLGGVSVLWFPSLPWVLLAIEVALFLSVALVLAGFTVFKPLFEASAGLSLLIFLAQSYCAVPDAQRVSDAAMRSLLTLGLLYLAFYFFKSLFKEMKEKWDLVIMKDGSKKPWWPLALFAFFVGIFVVQLYQVLDPIVRSLCVYP